MAVLGSSPSAAKEYFLTKTSEDSYVQIDWQQVYKNQSGAWLVNWNEQICVNPGLDDQAEP